MALKPTQPARNEISCIHCNLENICLPRGLSKREIDRISQIVKGKKTLYRGDFIFRQGDYFQGIAAIKAGSAKLVSTDTHGNEHILNMLLPGELLGFDGLGNDRHHCSAIALETTRYCLMPAADMEQLFLHVPGLTRELFRHAGEIINFDEMQRLMHTRPAEERLAYFLISLSNRLYQRGFSPAAFSVPMTRQEIGDHLGLALETVCRLLKKFQNQKLITVRNRQIEIINPDGLKALLKV